VNAIYELALLAISALVIFTVEEISFGTDATVFLILGKCLECLPNLVLLPEENCVLQFSREACIL